MNHQLFEDWLFEHKKLSFQQKEQLTDHLKQCKQCQQLALAWKMVEKQIIKSAPIPPRPGFVNRWRASLSARKAAHQKEDGRRWLIGLSSGAILTLIILIVLNSDAQSVSSMVGSAVNLYTLISTWGSQARNFIFILVNTIPSYIWIAIFVALAGWLVVAGLVWLYALNRFRKGGVVNETQS